MSSLIKTQLGPHQEIAVERMTGGKRFLLADGTGKGKTLATMASYASLLEENPDRRLLVIANEASLVPWRRQTVEHTRLTILTGESKTSKKDVAALRAEDPQIIVLTYTAIVPRKHKKLTSRFYDDVFNIVFHQVGEKPPTGEEWIETIPRITNEMVRNGCLKNVREVREEEIELMIEFLDKLRREKRITGAMYEGVLKVVGIKREKKDNKDWKTWYEHSDYRDYLMELYDRHPNIILVLEEAHNCKAPSTLRTKFLIPVVRASEYVWMLTATPLQDRIQDVYYLMDLLMPGFFGTLGDFYRRYTIRTDKYVGYKKTVRVVVGYKNLDGLKKRLAPYMLKRSLDVEVEFKSSYTDFTPEELSLYLKAAKGILDDTEDSIRDFGARLPDLQRVTDGATLDQRELNLERKLTSKERLLLTELHNAYRNTAGKCAIVSCYFKLTYKRLQFVLSAAEKYIGYNRLLTVSVEDDVEARMRIEKQLSPGDMLLITSAAKESLNFGQADDMWLYNVPWSAGMVMQIIGRMTRLDSPHKHFTVHVPVVRDTIDEYKIQVWIHKSDLFGQVLRKEATMPVGKSVLGKDQLAELRAKLLWKIQEEDN